MRPGARIPLGRIQIGKPQNSVNPYTGAPEFSTFSNRTFGANSEGSYEDDNQVGGYIPPMEEITIYGNTPEPTVPLDLEGFARSIGQDNFGGIPSDGGGGALYGPLVQVAGPSAPPTLKQPNEPRLPGGLSREQLDAIRSNLGKLTGGKLSESQLDSLTQQFAGRLGFGQKIGFGLDQARYHLPSFDDATNTAVLTSGELNTIQNQIGQIQPVPSLPASLRGNLLDAITVGEFQLCKTQVPKDPVPKAEYGCIQAARTMTAVRDAGDLMKTGEAVCKAVLKVKPTAEPCQEILSRIGQK
jgi:hypothetical protein